MTIHDLRDYDYFLYTQNSIATFENCPMKFQLRYMENLKWETFPDEKVKQNIQRGIDFHLLAYRYFMGLRIDNDEFFEDKQLFKWLKILEYDFKISEKFIYLPEFKIRMTDDILKVEANYDLIIIKDNAIEIWDWKTRSNDNDKKKFDVMDRLKNSFQTKVYMFVLWEQISQIKNIYKRKENKELNIEEKDLIMNYWNPIGQSKNNLIAKVNYSKEYHERIKEILYNKISRIIEYNYNNFEKELYQKHCKICEFNWYCNNEKIDLCKLAENEEFIEEFIWDEIEERF